MMNIFLNYHDSQTRRELLAVFSDDFSCLWEGGEFAGGFFSLL